MNDRGSILISVIFEREIADYFQVLETSFILPCLERLLFSLLTLKGMCLMISSASSLLFLLFTDFCCLLSDLNQLT